MKSSRYRYALYLCHPGKRCLLLTVVAIFVVWGLAGCSRQDYRLRADKEVMELVGEKSADERWPMPNFDVYPDCRSRFHDPHDPDHPPIPEDDPESARYMRCVYGMKGYKKWYRDGVALDLQNPEWEVLLPSYARFTEANELELDLATAALLARVHSSTYQRNLEEVYLAALDVAFERFRFDVQFAGGNTTTLRTRGNLPAASLGAGGPGSSTSSSTILNTQTSLEARRNFAAGAELLVGIANSMVWQFAGPESNFATSILNFSLLQPLLRNGGKPVILERLTRAERNLLGAFRSQAQFRQEFFKNVAMGGGTSVRPNRIGGFRGGAGLSGFTGTGLGGFGGVGAGQNFGGFGAGLAGGGEGTVGGFYGLVQQIQAIRNTQASLAAQINMLGLLEANFQAGLIDLVQVDEFRQNIETERANLLRSQVGFQDALEFYMIDTLNLPPWMEVQIDDSLIDQFQLIGPNATSLQNRSIELQHEHGDLPIDADPSRIEEIAENLEEILGETLELHDTIQAELADSEDLKQDRLDEIEDQHQRLQLEAVFASITKDLSEIAHEIKASSQRLESITKEFRDRPEDINKTVNLLAESNRDIAGQIQELSLLQARTRLEKVTIEPIDLSDEDAIQIARANRLDWMNIRAQLVDQWRLITFNANRLESTLDIQLEGDLGTIGDNPLKFRGPTGSLQAKLVFDAPLNRKSERNLYRESLIEYQRAKRSYITYVDRVELGLRSLLRRLKRLRTNLEIQRLALRIAIRRVDQTIEELNKPLPPSNPGEPPSQHGPTLAQNLLRALSDLRNTQDNFMSVWINYESAKMNLLFALGIMQFEESGTSLDQPATVLIDQKLQECRAEGSFEGEKLSHSLEMVSEDFSSESITAEGHEGKNAEGLANSEGPNIPNPNPSESTTAGQVPNFPTEPDCEKCGSREEFAGNLRRVRMMAEKGDSIREIATSTGLNEKAVLVSKRIASGTAEAVSFIRTRHRKLFVRKSN